LSIGVQVALLVFFIACSAYSSCAETAITSLSAERLVYLKNAHHKKRRAFDLLLAEPTRPITALLVLNNLTNVAASSVMTLLTVDLLGGGLEEYQVALVATGVMTVSLLLFSEITPKSFAKNNAERVALATVTSVYVLTRAIGPLVFLFRKASSGLLRLVGVDPSKREPVKVSDEQIETLLDASEKTGLLHEEDSDMIRRILDFDEITAEQVMVPRTTVRMIEAHTPLAQAREIVGRDGHSRFPVYDRVQDNVVGTLHAKDLLACPDDSGKTLRSLLRPVHYTPTTKPINLLLRELQRARVHLAIVIDEFGGMAGVVTLEDILEEIVGEIEDEYDRPMTLIKRVSPDEAIVDGDTPIHQLSRAMAIDLPEDEGVTVSGLVLHHLEAMPKSGDTVQVGPVTLHVEKATEREVSQVRVTVARPDDEDETSE
jgi:CBS domain containing-hemolysin-like protein